MGKWLHQHYSRALSEHLFGNRKMKVNRNPFFEGESHITINKNNML